MKRLMLTVCMMLIFLIGCSSISQEDPQKLLDQTLEQFSKTQLVVKLEQSGSRIMQHESVSWNPLSDIEQFRSQVQDVTYNRDQSDTKQAVLDVTMNPDAAKNHLAEQLQARLKLIQSNTAKLAKPDSSRTTNKMKEEIAARLMTAEKELAETITALSVGSKVQLWVDRRSMLPILMKVNTSIHYPDKTRSVETITESFNIS